MVVELLLSLMYNDFEILSLVMRYDRFSSMPRSGDRCGLGKLLSLVDGVC
jgi:hypothetical protein